MSRWPGRSWFFKSGDAVFYAGAIDRPGTNAELHAVDERIVGPKPESLTAAQAAALPLTSLTAWELLFDRLGVPYGRKLSDDAILIVNGARGVRLDPHLACPPPPHRPHRDRYGIAAGDDGLVPGDGRPPRHQPPPAPR
jgi:hypothetical protein